MLSTLVYKLFTLRIDCTGNFKLNKYKFDNCLFIHLKNDSKTVR